MSEWSPGDKAIIHSPGDCYHGRECVLASEGGAFEDEWCINDPSGVRFGFYREPELRRLPIDTRSKSARLRCYRVFAGADLSCVENTPGDFKDWCDGCRRDFSEYESDRLEFDTEECEVETKRVETKRVAATGIKADFEPGGLTGQVNFDQVTTINQSYSKCCKQSPKTESTTPPSHLGGRDPEDEGTGNGMNLALNDVLVDQLMCGDFDPDIEFDEGSTLSFDAVNHPPHYNSHPSGIECIQVAEHMNFNLGNALKYIWRSDLKADAIEDLKKAVWYIERELSRRARAKENNNG